MFGSVVVGQGGTRVALTGIGLVELVPSPPAGVVRMVSPGDESQVDVVARGVDGSAVDIDYLIVLLDPDGNRANMSGAETLNAGFDDPSMDGGPLSEASIILLEEGWSMAVDVTALNAGAFNQGFFYANYRDVRGLQPNLVQISTDWTSVVTGAKEAVDLPAFADGPESADAVGGSLVYVNTSANALDVLLRIEREDGSIEPLNAAASPLPLQATTRGASSFLGGWLPALHEGDKLQVQLVAAPADGQPVYFSAPTTTQNAAPVRGGQGGAY